MGVVPEDFREIVLSCFPDPVGLGLHHHPGFHHGIAGSDKGFLTLYLHETEPASIEALGRS